MCLMCQDSCELICVKLGMMPNTTKLYSLISVWMPLMFIQGQRVTEMLELVQLFCCKAAWRNLNVCDSCLCKEDDLKKSWKYGEYRSFEHLVCLYVVYLLTETNN